MTVEDYMKMPYTKIIEEIDDESGHYYYGRIGELDGCSSTGDTIDDLYRNLNEALEGYIEAKIEFQLPIPLPDNKQSSENYLLSIPMSLYKRLLEEAGSKGVNINQYALFKLAQ